MKHIIFICGRNAGRSQMAQAWFNNKNKNRSVKALSAGDSPAGEIDENAVKVLLTDGIDIKDNPDYLPKMIDNNIVKEADAIYTMGCNVSCPAVDRGITFDFELDDPHGKGYEEVLEIYKILKEKMEPIINKYNF